LSHGRYILDGKIPVPCEDLLEWAQWIEKHQQDRVVKQEYIGTMWVSTVFLGLDHDHFRKGPPLLFETMIFRDANEQDRQEHREFGFSGKIQHVTVDDSPMWRTYTWELALEQHDEAVEWALGKLA
jgi:hypothetical protein